MGDSDKITTAIELRKEVRRRGARIAELEREVRALKYALSVVGESSDVFRRLDTVEEAMRVVEARITILEGGKHVDE